MTVTCSIHYAFLQIITELSVAVSSQKIAGFIDENNEYCCIYIEGSILYKSTRFYASTSTYN